MISEPSLSTWIGIGRLVGDHLWQSTLFAAIVGLLTLAFRNHRAQVRNALWLAASLKFLIPFAALVAIGSRFGWRHAVSVAPAPFAIDMDTVSQPFSRLAVATPPAVVSHNMTFAVPILLFAIWFCGFSAILLISWMRLRRVAAAVREGSPARQGRELELVRHVQTATGMTKLVALILSNKSMEPYIFGIVNPVLLWPRSLTEHLSDAQMEAILAHELCHVRRRDNLAASAHLLVESLFWFHPLVWWLGARIVDERERACDEEVLRLGVEPVVYADGILKICEFYLESPIACAAGVTGSDLKKRMERIMRNQIGETLNGWRKVFLATAGVVALAVPIVVGVLTAPRLRAQSPIPADQPKFDAASVKPHDPKIPGARFAMEPGGYYISTNIPLDVLISNAYGPINLVEESGWSDWIRSARYDVEAKAEGNPTRDQMWLMVRSLLADRFKLVVHREIRQLPVYALVASKPGKIGPQLTPHTNDANCIAPPPPLPNPPEVPQNRAIPPCGGFLVRRGHWASQEITMEQFARRLSGIDGRMVLDRTGISGTFDFTLDFGAAPPPNGAQPGATATEPDPSALQSIFTAMQEQLGLKLEPATGPVNALVIDHVQEPSPN